MMGMLSVSKISYTKSYDAKKCTLRVLSFLSDTLEYMMDSSDMLDFSLIWIHSFCLCVMACLFSSHLFWAAPVHTLRFSKEDARTTSPGVDHYRQYLLKYISFFLSTHHTYNNKQTHTPEYVRTYPNPHLFTDCIVVLILRACWVRGQLIICTDFVLYECVV